ncbi:phosphoribosylformylglycinamidine synthase [bacterium E08(2017)]|nr:phosphoribosylformylglycinamidine synthase [bacterium E08(2017)]
MEPIILQGAEALSQFRIDALIQNINSLPDSPKITEINATFVYFLETEAELSNDVMQKAMTLLSATGPFSPSNGFFVTPRKGTISPWSSKATDIFTNCSISEVKRVERGIYYVIESSPSFSTQHSAFSILFDRMTEGVYEDVSDIFHHIPPTPYIEVDVLEGGHEALEKANIEMGLALSDDEIDYLYESYTAIKRNPTDVELVMFGQVNSEHCRHKIFNADWIIDGETKDRSLFSMIRNTHEKHPEGTLIAYKDNSGVIEGFHDEWFEVDRTGSNNYKYNEDQVDMIMKVETHNHPTAISPYPGASTGVGGEIRDEGATGTGSKSKAGLTAFMVSNLRIPGFIMPWEKDYAEFPSRLATPLEIMTEGPLGGAAFSNEFGRPNLLGFFKTYEEEYNGRYRGYHKPIMVAGGMGNIKRQHTEKEDIPAGSYVLQIGGPAMRIGLGGGAASSMATGSNAAELDFDSVQRDNAEMQRRCQEVIDACISLNEDNPILSIHDIGAGGLSNGCPELISETGGSFKLREIHNEDTSMSPMEIWCCEAQERYVLAIPHDKLDFFLGLCERERCPVAVVGEATGDGHLVLEDSHFDNRPIDIDLSVILGKPPKMLRDVSTLTEEHPKLDLSKIDIYGAADRVLRLPAVANKTFLISIGDRSVTGMVARDQMVGPYQCPISDVAVTTTSLQSTNGEAMSMGERSALALVSGPASGRMAIGEALTNLAAADVHSIKSVRLSANWMCACGEDGEDAALFETVKTVGMDLCPKLGVSIPVGKDSMSMRSVWETSDGEDIRQVAPLSLVVSAFSTVNDARKTVTPDIKPGESVIMLIDLGAGKNRLGGSALARVFNQVGDEIPDLDNPDMFVDFFTAIQELVANEYLMAYHDRSDGGLFTTLAEMAIAGRKGLYIELDDLGDELLPILFSEELGAVIQVSPVYMAEAWAILEKHGLEKVTHQIGRTKKVGVDQDLQSTDFTYHGDVVFTKKITELNRAWSEMTYKMQSLRDNPECAQEEYDALLDDADQGMNFKLTFDPEFSPCANIQTASPPMAILREQGINGQVEMAAAFERAGFNCVDIHMTDLFAGRQNLDDFKGLVACGGFSYGDVLGAGSGWARSILYNDELKEMFARFFAREDTFSLGVCNGCQMMSQLKDIIPGAEHWPEFVRNKCERFEARYVTVEIMNSPSIFFNDMEGAHLGIPVAHGEGRVDFSRTGSLEALRSGKLVSARYLDHYGNPTEVYPLNPNGSDGGVTGITSSDGRATIMMPHPERGFRSVQMSYRPKGMFDGEAGPWLRMFQNARTFVG